MASNAPGKHFREGLSLVQLTRMFPTDEAAAAWVEKIRWPEGPICPHCGSHRIAHPVTHKTMTHRCKDCRKWFSVRTGTVMQSSKLGYRVWAMATYLLTGGFKGTSKLKLHRHLGISRKSAWHLAHRIRETWIDWQVAPFSDPAGADEAYIGSWERDKLIRGEHRARQIRLFPGRWSQKSECQSGNGGLSLDCGRLDLARVHPRVNRTERDLLHRRGLYLSRVESSSVSPPQRS